jgi:hypothetical protein
MSEQPPTPPTASYASGPPAKPHRGVLILVFGILSFVICPIFGILAWIWGNNDLKELDAGIMDREGRGLTQAGRILGMVSCILWVVAIAFWVLMVVCSIGAAAIGGG